jgi:hypothetical protein
MRSGAEIVAYLRDRDRLKADGARELRTPL